MVRIKSAQWRRRLVQAGTRCSFQRNTYALFQQPGLVRLQGTEAKACCVVYSLAFSSSSYLHGLGCCFGPWHLGRIPTLQVALPTGSAAWRGSLAWSSSVNRPPPPEAAHRLQGQPGSSALGSWKWGCQLEDI